MSKWIDLTLPLYDAMPVGNVWAWDVPFESTPITNDEFNGYELTMIKMFSETGTRLMIRAMQDKTAPRVHELPLEDLMDRQCVVLDIPGGEDHEVSAAEIDAAFEGADFRKGDAIILRTGWGDDERWEKIGDDYSRKFPWITNQAANRLVEIMHANDSDLVGTDCPYWGGGRNTQLPLWASKPMWERHPFPSLQARRFLAQYTKEMAYNDFGSPNIMNSADVMYIGAMCNLGALTKPRCKLSVIPLKIKGARGATCRCIAFEEG